MSLEEATAKYQASQIQAPVLANRFPPYMTRGGLYYALVESRGTVFSITNDEALEAAKLFETVENIDIEPAAGVAFASLLIACKTGALSHDGTVVLNITGGGRRRFASEFRLIQHHPDLFIEADNIGTGIDREALIGLYS